MMIDEVSRSPSHRKQPAIALLLIAGVLCAAWWAVEPRLLAQSVGLPAPRLLTTTPMGGKAGSQIDITITGENIDDADALTFSDRRITASRKLSSAGQPEPNKYLVSIAADCPVGIYEARVMTRLGISSSRAFSVGALDEVTPAKSGVSLPTAVELKVNSICNATITQRAVDHYVFAGQKGQRIIVDCAARGIDSKLDAVVIVADAAGRDLQVERRGGTLDFTVPEDERYVIKVHDLTFKGGPAYFYRLGLWELPIGAPIVRLPTTKPVNSYSWPPQDSPDHAAIVETEPNNDRSHVQRVSLPCDIAGSFFPAADVDVFEFEAKKGEVWWIEVASERFRLPTDPAILVQQVKRSGDDEKLTDVAEFSDIPSPVKVSSNGYAYDGPPYNAGSADILGKLEIKEDGRYRLQLTDLFGGTRSEPRNVYRLVIRKAAPDFALVAWALHMELRNGDRNAVSKPLALRGGATMALEVVAFRRDGFDGEINLAMSDLPVGVTATGLKIPAGQSRGLMLVTANQNAPRAIAHAAFVGRATIDGKEVTHPCRLASMAWPILDSWSEIPFPRLLADVPVSVSGSEFAPFTIAPPADVVQTVSAGGKLTIPLFHTRRSEFSGATMQLRTMGAGFERVPAFSISLTADQSQAVIDTATLKTPPGDYLIAFYGAAVAKHKPQSSTNSADAKAAAAPRDIVDIVVSEPIAIRVEPAGKK